MSVEILWSWYYFVKVELGESFCKFASIIYELPRAFFMFLYFPFISIPTTQHLTAFSFLF